MIYQIVKSMIEGGKHSTGNIHRGLLEKSVSDFAKRHSFDDEVDGAMERVQSPERAITEIAASIDLNSPCGPDALHI